MSRRSIDRRKARRGKQAKKWPRNEKRQTGSARSGVGVELGGSCSSDDVEKRRHPRRQAGA